MMKPADGPLPAQLMAPWLEDNAQFMRELQKRNLRLANCAALRQKHEREIKVAFPSEPCLLGAVDAASILVPFGDQVSILVQAISVADDGTTTLGVPQRVTGIDGHELRLAATPMRLEAECRALAAVKQPTIADTSYWSFLMEVNQAITRQSNGSLPALEASVKSLVDDQIFLDVITNPFVIPMSKTSQSDTFFEGVSDRHFLGEILHPGEYIIPRSLIIGTTGSFGIEKRRFKDSERSLLDDFFQNRLGVLFFKPHPWTRAYRIEGHLEQLQKADWLMPLLAAISKHTADNRMVVEPWPQFMADYTAKKLSALGKLYGDLNWHRYPEANYRRARTR